MMSHYYSLDFAADMPKRYLLVRATPDKLDKKFKIY